jgi:hypothetical protein
MLSKSIVAALIQGAISIKLTQEGDQSFILDANLHVPLNINLGSVEFE